jgi:hypothetical protein
MIEQEKLPSVSQDRLGEKEVAGEPTASTANANLQLQDILAAIQMMQASVKEGNEKLQRDVREGNEILKEDIQKSVQESIKEGNDKLRGEINKLKEEVQAETKGLIDRFQKQQEQLDKSLNAKLQFEVTKVMKSVREVREDSEREIVAAKRSFDGLAKELHEKVEANLSSTKELNASLYSQVILHKEDVDKQVKDISDKLDQNKTELQKGAEEEVERLTKELKKIESSNKDQYDLLNNEVTVLKSRLSENMSNASTLPPNEINCMHSNRSASCESNDVASVPQPLEGGNVNSGVNESCVDRMNASANVPGINVSSFASTSCLGPNELILPGFDDYNKVNAIFHLNELENYFLLKGTPKRLWLAIALRSLTDVTAKRWVSAISHSLTDYGQFKVAFVNAFWSPSKQSKVRKSIYQDKYDRQSGLSLSAHFLKYAVQASYLQPKLEDSELISALMSHYPVFVQRNFCTMQIRTTQEAIEFLQRIESIEETNNYQRSTSEAQTQGDYDSGGRQNNWNERQRRNSNVRQTQVAHYQGHNQNRRWQDNRQNGRNDYRNDRRNDHERPADRQRFNPNAAPFNSQNQQGANSNDAPGNRDSNPLN